MFSLSRLAALAVALASAASAAALRVCADPNNLPFSNERREGFENRIAEVVARELNMDLEYTWWSQRKRFIPNTLEAGRCDVLPGAPAALGGVLTTAPYYRSAYVFVHRPGMPLRSLEDPKLARVRIGIHVVGNDFAPPAFALARRGVVANVRGYSLFGEYGEENPPARLIEAVARGDIDVAIAWGPFGGYFARRQPVPLEVSEIPTSADLPSIPLAWDISMAVREGEEELRARLDRALAKQKAAIDRILREFSVPVARPAAKTWDSAKAP